MQTLKDGTTVIVVCGPCEVASVAVTGTDGKRCPACGGLMVRTTRSWLDLYPR